MSKFVRECCDQGGPDKTVVIDTLYERYREWCNGEGEKPLPKTLFGRDLRAVLPRLDDEKPHGQQRRYIGIALRPHRWGRSIETHNAVPFGSSGSNGSTADFGPDEPHEPHGSPLQPPIDGVPTCQHNGCPTLLYNPQSAELGLCLTHQRRNDHD